MRKRREVDSFVVNSRAAALEKGLALKRRESPSPPPILAVVALSGRQREGDSGASVWEMGIKFGFIKNFFKKALTILFL